MRGSEVVVLGFTFKENCPDVRNTRVIDIVRRLEEYHVDVCIHDPWANAEEVAREYNVECQNGEIEGRKFDAIILAVPHAVFNEIEVSRLLRNEGMIYDIKGFLSKEIAAERL